MSDSLAIKINKGASNDASYFIVIIAKTQKYKSITTLNKK